MAFTTNQSAVAELYIAALGRSPEMAGLDYWVGRLESTGSDALTLTQIQAAFFDNNIAEVAARFPVGTTAAQYVEAIYVNVFGRASDSEGSAFWSAKIATDGADSVMAQMLTIAKDPVNSVDKAYLESKIATATAAYDAEVDAVTNLGQTFMLTTAANDVIVGTTGNDTITATTATDDAADIVLDNTSTDNDTMNWTATDATAALRITKVENVNVSIANTAAKVVDAENFTGISNLTVTRADVTVAGSTITGNKAVSVTHVDGVEIAKITTGAGTTTVAVDQSAGTITESKAGTVVDAATATGTVTVTGAATVTAGTTGTGNKVTVQAINDASLTAENAKAVSITAAEVLEAEVKTNTELMTGAVTINAAKANTITVDNAVGGVTITAGTTSVASTTITVSNIDASGATITTGTGAGTSSVTTDKEISIELEGTILTTDAATVSAAGTITLDANNAGQVVDILNLSGNGAAATYTIADGDTVATYNLTGNQSITVSNTAAAFAGATALTDSTTAGTTTAKVTTVATADLSGIAADVIKLNDTGTAAVITVATGANIQLAADQNTSLAFAGKTTGATVSVATADDTAANGTTIELTVAAFTASTYVQTLNIDATVGKFTATSTTLDIAGTDATTLNITGTKNVTLGTTIAKTINAADLTGALSLTMTDNTNAAAAAVAITSGTGNDALVFNDVGSDYSVFTVDAGNGTNEITITAAKETSSFASGTGSDTVHVNANAAYVITTGDGSDTVNIGDGVDTDSIIIGGAGTGDVLKFLEVDGSADLNAKTNFAFSGFETLNIAALTSGELKISNAQFNAQTLTVLGDAVADKLVIVDQTAVGSTIDASNVTVTTAVLELQGGAGADIITGSAYADLIDGGVGADTLSGGDGSDTYVAVTTLNAIVELEGASTGVQTGMVVNLSSAAITNTTILGTSTGYTADTVTSVATNSAAYLYAASASTNASTVDTLASVENVTGSAGADYIVGSAGANTINSGAGADYVIGGLGIDTIGLGGADTAADRVVISDITASANRDVITGFVTTSDDIIIGLANTTVATAAGNAVATSNTTVAGVGGGALALTGATTANCDVIIMDNVTAAGANSGDLSLTTAAGLDGTELLKALTTAGAADTYTGITAAAASQKVYIQATQGGVNYLYFASDADADSLIEASEIALVGTITTTAAGALVQADYTVA